LLKNSDKTEIIAAIHAASMHQQYYDKSISAKLARYVSQTKVQKQTPLFFTEKELQVIRYICMEFSNKEISKEMYVSERTIEGYRSKLLQKMNVKSTVGIVIYAIQHNLFTVDAMNTSEDN
jgi:DNA-binding NarL/FixJ family response regulator